MTHNIIRQNREWLVNFYDNKIIINDKLQKLRIYLAMVLPQQTVHFLLVISTKTDDDTKLVYQEQDNLMFPRLN